MVTYDSDIIDSFKDELINDPEFFIYDNLTNQESEEFVNEKCRILLKKAISEIMLKCSPDVDFYDRDEIMECFNFELTNNEKNLIVRLMFQKYFEQDKTKLKVMIDNFSTKDVNRFSPSAERKSFMDMLKDMVEDNEVLLSNYQFKDRLTGKYKKAIFTQSN